MGRTPATIASIGNILTSPVWTIVIGLITIGVTLEIFRRGRTRRVLTWSVTTRSLLNVGSEVAGNVEILFEDEPVRHVHLVTVTIANRGNMPITAADFERRLAITLTGSRRLLTAQLQDVKPESLTPELAPRDDGHDPQIVIEPLLLNPGDAFTVSAMVGDFDGTVDVSGRIAGVRDLVEDREDLRFGWDEVFDLAFGLLFIAAVAVALVPSVIHRWNDADHHVVDFVFGRNAEEAFHTAQLTSGRRVCVRVVGFDGSHQILKVKNSSSDRLLSVLPADVHLTSERC